MIVTIICVIDYTEQNDDFLKHNVPVSEIFGNYYLNLIPYYANMLSPLMVFIATVFMTAKLASHTEIIAILASGVSFLRFLLPYFIGSLIIAVLTFYLNGWVIPQANQDRMDFEFTYLRNTKRFSDRDIHMKISDQEYIYLQNFDNTLQTGHKFTLEKIVDNKLVEKLTTSKIAWDSAIQKWRIRQYKIQKFDGEKQDLTFGNNMDTSLVITPNDFKTYTGQVETLTLPALDEYIKEQQRRGADNLEVYLVNYHERYTYPFAIIILSLIGVIVSARKSRQGVGAQIALGFTLAFVFILFVVLSRNLALVGGMHPMIAAWTPSSIFVIIGILLFKYVPK